MAAATVKQGKQLVKYVLGTCMPSAKGNAARIKVRRFELDKNLLMYWNEFEYLFAHDPNKLCKTGDTVLIQQLPERLTRLITHKVVEVIYPMGDITDPVTGKKVVVSKYRDEIKETNELYGESESAFNYEERPPRGSLEDKLDFSHKPSYIKYHEDPDKPQPYAV
ncbi:28S ribosomal protein S17, mitochondrial [Diachasma alloeum]|uniref:28S ribosomal protein S17, mitochondrial n=1 Tax=Diachasma alloeum TaxID=454923 RepID=UPI000738149F|nr:28S ribosomal protein S17, mitochondrial [Diachasma alloeum]XP_015112786.1 28S ribosomal protein S17, mitochondrial [Diachasma alloeum]